MTYEQFWEQNVDLVKYYRQAWKLKQEAKNQDLWLMGAYVYEAILNASPVLHDFVKKGTKPIPYRDAPYPLYKKPEEEKPKAIEQAERKSDKKAQTMMEIFMVSFNRRFEKKGGEGNGG